MLDRILLFLFAVIGAGLVVAAVVAFPTDRRAATLYLVGALCLAGLVWRSWKRVAASIRARAGRGTGERHI